ncbi:MAG: Holliday junction resolvase RuvX [Candidatus Bipolaricaulaceae bacterium]
MKRVLALDVGERRVGLARTDETGTLAVPHGVYVRKGWEEDVRKLAELARDLGAEALVVGLPLHMDGRVSPQAQEVRAFAEAVAREAALPLHFVDERWTTAEVERVLGEAGLPPRKRKGKVDALSAVLILQAWLDRVRSQGGERDAGVHLLFGE